MKVAILHLSTAIKPSLISESDEERFETIYILARE
jgi:hypothetical protein